MSKIYELKSVGLAVNETVCDELLKSTLVPIFDSVQGFVILPQNPNCHTKIWQYV